MSVKGSTALVRMASNPECEILGAMVLQPGSEKRFYERVVGKPYDREFGERQSSKRRGAQFEQNAYAGDARLLREALAEALQTHAEHLTVRNLLDDYPGAKDDARIGRLRITRGILMDAYAGRAAPDIIVQPQLLLPTKPGPKPFFFIGPDLLIRSRENGMYLPGDLKSFIVRENEIAPSDLARVRLQLGAQVLALRHEYDRIDRSVAVPGKGVRVLQAKWPAPSCPSDRRRGGGSGGCEDWSRRLPASPAPHRRIACRGRALHRRCRPQTEFSGCVPVHVCDGAMVPTARCWNSGRSR